MTDKAQMLRCERCNRIVMICNTEGLIILDFPPLHEPGKTLTMNLDDITKYENADLVGMTDDEIVKLIYKSLLKHRKTCHE